MVDRVPTIDEIDSKDTLEAYLRTRPVEEGQLIALRSLIRAMPRLSDALVGNAKIERTLILALRFFRCGLISWAAREFPEHDMREVALAASDFDWSNGPAIEDAASLTATTIAATMIAKNGFAYFAAGAVASASASERPFWEAVRRDLRRCQKEGPDAVKMERLWGGVEPPQWIENAEILLRQQLASVGDQWVLLWDLYLAHRVARKPYLGLENRREDIIVSVALESGEFWDRDPDEVMKDISQRLHGEMGMSGPDEDPTLDRVTEQLVQTPADFRFSAYDNQPIDAIPFSDTAIDIDFAETTLAEAIEKAQEFRERLEHANADPHVKRSVERLLKVLPQQIEALNPALMRSKTRALEASAAAYIAAGVEAELFPHAVADLLDLVGTLKDLQGCFPKIADVERNTVAFDIAGREHEVEQALSDITASARELSASYPTMITTAAAEAVGILDDDISDASSQEVKRDLLARSALIKHNYLSAFYRKILSPVGREALRVGTLYYGAALGGSVVSIRTASEKAFPAFVAYQIGGPLAAAAVFLPELFNVLKQTKDATDNLTKGDDNEADTE